MNILSRSMLGVAGGALVLCAIGTLGFMSASANQQGSSESRASNGNLALTPGTHLPQDSGSFVLAQGMMGMGGGGMAGMGGGGMGGGMPGGINAPKELVIQWEKPTAPVPPWLEGIADAKEREDNIRRALSERGEVNFNGTPLSGVMKHFREVYGIPIVLSEKELEDENITPDEPITLELPTTSFRNSLSMILSPLGLTYVIDKECLIITSKKARWGSVRSYDLSYVLPDNGLVTELISTIEAVISPDQWQSGGGSYCIRSVGSMLVVKADEETYFAIERMLRTITLLPPANLKPRVFLDRPASKPAESEKAVEKR